MIFTTTITNVLKMQEKKNDISVRIADYKRIDLSSRLTPLLLNGILKLYGKSKSANAADSTDTNTPDSIISPKTQE